MIEDSGNGKLREATVAGIFYPEDPEALRERLDALLDASMPSTLRASAIISPHGGLDYSGDLSALAWKSASGRPVDRVIVISPHHRAEDSSIYLPESEAFDTPLGPIRVDLPLVEELRDCGTLFEVNDIPHLEDHGIEMQLPFMRRLFPEAALLPVIMGKPTAMAVRALGSALGIAVGPVAGSSLIVVSTSFASGPDDEEVRRATDRMIELVAAKDARGVLELGCAPGATVCGACCLAAYLASPLCDRARVLILGRHDSSHSRYSGEERLVEYLAAAFVDEEEEAP